MRSRQAASALPITSPAGWLPRWWLDRSVRTKGLIVIAVPLIALIGTVSTSLALLHSARHERRVALTANGLSSAADLVLADVVNAETGVSGYDAARDPLFLSSYNIALAQIGAQRKALRAAAVAEGDVLEQQAADVSAGRELSELAKLRSAISRGTPGRDLLAALETARKTMDSLRRQVAVLTAAPARLVVVERGKITRLQSAINLLNIAGLVAALTAAIAGVALFTSGISRRVVAAAANADRLGEGEALRPVRGSRDELGQLARSLVRAEQLLASRATELTAARDEALRATQAKSTFLSRTSHELRTPLNSILGFTQLLEMSELSAENQESAGRILSAGRHLLALINELIDIARIESGELSLALEPVSVSHLIEEVSQLMGPLAAARSIKLIRGCVHPGLAALADRQRLSQILVNLAANAVKYSRRGGTVTMSGQEESAGRAEGTGQAGGAGRAEGAGRSGGASQVSVVVSDTGPGMSPDDLQRIFVPFDRLGAEQAGIEGTGIGLPLAQALTEAMGGRLSASSVLGEGSAFTVTLPRAPDLASLRPHDAAQASSSGPHAADAAAISILCIEDNPANVEVVSRFLRVRPGASAQFAGSGRAGIECARRDLPDVILLDLHLPDIPGELVLSELMAEPVTAAIPVVILSAEASPSAIRRLLASGAHAYLTKPLDLAELGARLDSVTASAQDHQARTPTPATPA